MCLTIRVETVSDERTIEEAVAVTSRPEPHISSRPVTAVLIHLDDDSVAVARLSRSEQYSCETF